MQKKADSHLTVRSVLALPVFPGRCQPSIVSRNELNYRVRNGNGWTLALISTNFIRGHGNTCRDSFMSFGFPKNKLHYKGFCCICQEKIW